jgi:hypothetical protein
MHRARRRYASRAAARDKKPNKWHRWSDYFAPKKLRTLIAARMDAHADNAFLTARMIRPDSRKRDNWRVVPSAA